MLPGSETFPRDPDVLIAMVMSRDLTIAKLEASLKAAKDFIFGPKSEKSSIILADQTCLDLGDLETDATAPVAANDEAPRSKLPRRERKRAVRNIGGLAKHLPRVTEVIEPASLNCPCCAGALHKISEPATEALDGVPSTLRVLRTVRPKYACRGCEGAIVQAPAKRRMFDGGMATTALIASVIVWKFAWYLPLYRQSQIFDGQGVHLDRGTLALWVKRSAWWLSGLYQRQLEIIHAQEKMFADETRMPVQDKAKRQVRIGWFWAYAMDDRPWNGPAPPAVVYVYARTRGAKEVKDHLADYHGTLQVDGYGAYKAVAKEARSNRPIQLAFCLAHSRRRFALIYKNTASPMAKQVIDQMALVYAIEAEIRGTDADNRRAVRQARTAPLMKDLKAILEAMLAQISSKTKLAEAIKYTLGHWAGLNLFLNDGRIEVDSNTVERSIRGIALGRRNSLFSGSDGGAESWAVLASLLQTAKLNGLDPYTWLHDVLEKIVSGEVKNHELDQLLAWNWKVANPQLALRAAA